MKTFKTSLPSTLPFADSLRLGSLCVSEGHFNMKQIHLTGKYGSVIGNYALVDDEDYEELNKYTWHCRKCLRTFYAVRSVNSVPVAMHRIIINAPNDMVVDHVDRNGLNNQKGNLRSCTRGQNCCNRASAINSSSKYLGVTKKGNQFQSIIKFKGKTIYIRLFNNEKDAAIAYDKKALELHGEFANLNFK